LLEEGRSEKKIIENVAPATVTFPTSDSYIRQLYIANARCVAGSAQAVRKIQVQKNPRLFFLGEAESESNATYTADTLQCAELQ
jgi:hypothetical protein